MGGSSLKKTLLVERKSVPGGNQKEQDEWTALKLESDRNMVREYWRTFWFYALRNPEVPGN